MSFSSPPLVSVSTSTAASAPAGAPPIHIPFNRASLVGTELEYVNDAIQGGHISGDGRYTRRCQGLLQSLVGTQKAMLTTSCTAALDMTALLINIQPGDEVILPSFTFVSTANAFALRGARLVFADVRPDTLNIDERQIEELIGPRTCAIVVVHYAGVGCEMDRIMELAARHAITVIEDNAHGFLGTYRGQALGTFGGLATLSFHETKNVTCGEGGALLINDPRYIARAEIVREKGTDRSRFLRGEVDKYTWVDIGSSFLPSDMLAAFLYGQLEAHAHIQQQRRAVWERYASELGDWAQAVGARLPVVPPHCEQSYHMFYLLMPTLEYRQALIDHLRARGILSVFHYIPLHSSRMGELFGARADACPVTQNVSDRLVRLPFYTSLSRHDQAEVIDGVRAFA